MVLVTVQENSTPHVGKQNMIDVPRYYFEDRCFGSRLTACDDGNLVQSTNYDKLAELFVKAIIDLAEKELAMMLVTGEENAVASTIAYIQENYPIIKLKHDGVQFLEDTEPSKVTT